MSAATRAFDFVVIGAGMAGASAAYFLSEAGSVAILEREEQPGYHTTGRSAALFSETYGNAQIRGLTSGGRDFFNHPPAGFAEVPLLTPRGALFVAREDQMAQLEMAAQEARQLVDSTQLIDGTSARALIPVLKADYVAGALYEPDAMDMDVHAILHGFLRGARARGAAVNTSADVAGLSHDGSLWQVKTLAGAFAAPIVVNAAGAWCDEIAELAGIAPVGLIPKRRIAFMIDVPEGQDIEPWPLCVDVDEEFYFKPDAGQLLVSPADETPMPPCDVQPEELDVAIAVERVQTATTIEIRQVRRRWAGLRSFVDDKTPVLGFEDGHDGFFWLAGQGGYGIQTAPSMGRVAAALAQGEAVPPDLIDLGVGADALSPMRFRGAQVPG